MPQGSGRWHRACWGALTARPLCSAIGARIPADLGGRSRLHGRGLGSPSTHSHRPCHRDTEPCLGLLWERDARGKKKNLHFPEASAPWGDAERSPAMRASEAGRPPPAGVQREARGVWPQFSGSVTGNCGQKVPDGGHMAPPRGRGPGCQRGHRSPGLVAHGEEPGWGPQGAGGGWPCPGPTVTEKHMPGGLGDRNLSSCSLRPGCPRSRSR